MKSQVTCEKGKAFVCALIGKRLGAEGCMLTFICFHIAQPVRSEFVTSAENARDSGQSSTNTSNTQQHSQQLSSRVAGIIYFNL